MIMLKSIRYCLFLGETAAVFGVGFAKNAESTRSTSSDERSRQGWETEKSDENLLEMQNLRTNVSIQGQRSGAESHRHVPQRH